MLSKPVFLASFLFLASFSTAARLEAVGELVERAAQTSTPPSTACQTIGGNKKHSRTYTRVSDCTNTLPKTKTSTTTTTTQPVTTTTVFTTETDTADTVTDTATDTETTTETTSVTSTETVTSTATTTVTTTTTSLYPLTSAGSRKRNAAPAEENALQARAPTTTRPAPTPGVVCVVNRCVRTRATTTVTQTSVLPESTATDSETQTTTVTPNASTTVTTTVTTTSTSSFTDTSTATTTDTETSTVTTTATPTFFILSGGNPNIPDGTQLTDVPDRQPGEGTGVFDGDGTLFALNPTTGELYDTSNMYYANGNAAGSSSFFYFDTIQLITSNSAYAECHCSIDTHTLELDCTCGGKSIFQTGGDNLYITTAAGGRGLAAENPTVQIVRQS